MFLVQSSLRCLVRPPALLAAIAVCLCLAAPASAAAATRYASPTGTGPSPCLEAEPCSVETALSFAQGLSTGDTVLLAPGTYHPAGELIVGGHEITVSAEPGKAAPLIEAAGERAILAQNQVTLRDLRFHEGPTVGYGVVVTHLGSVVERVESTGQAGQACAFVNVTVKDSLCVTEALGAIGLSSTFAGSTPETEELNLRNVTAIGAFGIDAVANDHSTVKIDAVNTIAQGSGFDVGAEVQAPLTAAVEIELSHSNFATVGDVGGAVITLPTENANQEAAPVFVDEAGGDFREAESSPTRLAGSLAAALPTDLDLAGNPRLTNCEGDAGVDIGAYQFECPPPADTPTDTPTTPRTSPAVTTPGEVTKPPMPTPAPKPRLSKLTTAGTAITFTLSAPATVKLEIGKKVVKTVKGKAGINRVKLPGKGLKAGTHKLRVIVVGGNSLTKTIKVQPGT